MSLEGLEVADDGCDDDDHGWYEEEKD